MNSKVDPHLMHSRGVQLGLWLLAIVPLVIGVWAFFAPYHFYEIFPFPGRHWISTLGSYNEHLIRDYGANNLGFGVLLTAAAVLLERQLIRVALASWLAFAIPHFIFHLTQTHHFSLFDNVTQLSSLGFVAVFPIILIFVTPKQVR